MTLDPNSELPSNEDHILLYETESGDFRMEVRLVGETVWLSLNQMAELFQRDKSSISRHIRSIFEEGELQKDSVVAKYATTAADGKTYQVEYYNLDVIISVGYRVKSHRGTQFRMWATQRLREYLIKGFAMDDQRLKEEGGSRYFEELLERIRDIRSSEKVFWRKVLDIYATSIDYNPQASSSQDFFKQVQNKMHWAAHGHTAAELIYERADANMPQMGVTNYPGKRLLKRDVEVAKNFLSEEELNILNRIVTAYLEFAELQALSRKTMTMQDWITRLDQFLNMTDRELLDHAGSISHVTAIEKAREEYERYRDRLLNEPTDVEKDYIESTEKELKAIEKKKKKQANI